VTVATDPDPETVQRIISRYREIRDHEKGGIRRLASEFGVSREVARRLLAAHGVLAARGRPPAKWNRTGASGTS
jgi:hypothetical protein